MPTAPNIHIHTFEATEEHLLLFIISTHDLHNNNNNNVMSCGAVLAHSVSLLVELTGVVCSLCLNHAEDYSDYSQNVQEVLVGLWPSSSPSTSVCLFEQMNCG